MLLMHSPRHDYVTTSDATDATFSTSADADVWYLVNQILKIGENKFFVQKLQIFPQKCLLFMSNMKKKN